VSFNVYLFTTVDSVYCDFIRSIDQLSYFIFEDRGPILCILFIGRCWWLFWLELLWISRKF